MKIAVVGVGRLGAVLAKALAKRHELVLIDKGYEHAREIASEMGATAARDLSEALEADMAVIAVKPAHVEDVAKQLKGARLIVSCAAGIPISKFESWGVQNVIRVMPNICADVGEAVIAYALHPEVEGQEKRFLTAFSSLGLCIKADESHLDPLTAASGSGPAFFAFFAEAMVEEAVRNGLVRETAEKAVAQTMMGTGRMMLHGWPPQKIISTVASPGGTTEAGLRMLEEKEANKAIHEAIRFAAGKARELGK